MTQTVQKQQSSNTDSEDQKLELENNLDKSWSGLYNRWKQQLERDFEDDPSQKWKLYLHGTIGGSLPILFSSIGTLSIPLIIIAFLWVGVLQKQNITEMVGNTAVSIMYLSGLLLYAIPFMIAISIVYSINKLKN